jgi:hypothetical protein
LRGIDMGVRRQNIRTKGVIGKILGNKELGEVRRLCPLTLVCP